MSEVRAALFDFGGVLTTSPFEAFARYEAEHGLPADFIRTVNATNPDNNAWARLERSEIDLVEFSDAFEAESASLGHGVPGSDVLGLLQGDLRPSMVTAVRKCADRMLTGLLTNNFVTAGEAFGEAPVDGLFESFDTIVESREVGVRKPDPAFYAIACERLGIDAAEAVFLDDLGVNLKPARAMGMATIKVETEPQALRDLEAIVGFALD